MEKLRKEVRSILDAEDVKIRNMRDTHRVEVRKMQHEHTLEIRKMQDQHTVDIRNMEDKHELEIRDMEDEISKTKAALDVKIADVQAQEDEHTQINRNPRIMEDRKMELVYVSIISRFGATTQRLTHMS